MKIRFLTLASCVLFIVPTVRAQETALSGTVHDTSGAVLLQATVKMTSHEQGTSRVVQTNEAGVYQFSFVQPGTYDIEIAAPGFKTLTRTNLTLAVAQNARLDFDLELGNVSENITVTAGTEAVNTETATLGAVVDNTRVVEMPLNGRIFFSLPTLTPGVLPPAQGSGLGYRGGFNVTGSCEGCNNFSINGMDNNDNTKTVPNFRPSIDAIQEFNVLTGVYPAEYGYGSGGQIIMTTRSGTNSYHGSAFEFLRNQSALTARNFFALPGPIPAFRRNQFGGTFGGPIRKDKTFFFYSYEGLRLSSSVIQLTTIPTPAMTTGDFSATGKTIKDPTTGAPFSGNVIPQSRINPVGAAIMAFFPLPTAPGPAGTLPNNNYTFSEPRTEAFDQHSMKLDQNFSSSDSAYLTVNWYYDHSVEWAGQTTCSSGTIPRFNCDFSQRSEVYGIAETHIFSPSLVNQARVAWSITIQPAIGRMASVDFWSQFGISPVIQSLPEIPHLGPPSVSITGYNSISGSGSFKRTDPHAQFSDAVSWTHDKHTVKIGFNVSHFSSNNSNVGTSTGSLSFTNTSQGPTSGYGMADLLLGLPASTGNQPYVNKIYPRAVNIGAYLQDDYKVSSSLTLNLGLRWEINPPPVDYGGHIVNFNVVTGTPVIEGTTSYLQYAPNGPSEHILHFDWHDYGPRVGFAWQPFHDGKTVVRGGAGTFFNNLSFYNGLSAIYIAYPIKNTFTSSLTQPITLANPFPASNAVAASNLNGADPIFRNARTYEWSLGIQRQIGKDMVFEITYFGSSASHLNQTQNINQPAPGAGTPAQVNARRPYPAWGTISYTEWDGNSHYDSMAAKLQKSYGYGLSFLASYTFSKSIDDLGAPTNAYNFNTARGLSSFDTRHRFVISPVYELPFGAGKPYVSQGVMAKIVGGWQLSPLVQWQTGTPLTAVLSGNYSNSSGTADRPDLVGDPNANAPHTAAEWFNIAAFALRPASGAASATYSFGNEGRSTIVGPGLVQMDVSIVRNFQPREWMKLQFRVEFFNLFNHTNFGFPNVTADNSQFGTISTALDPRESEFALKITF